MAECRPTGRADREVATGRSFKNFDDNELTRSIRSRIETIHVRLKEKRGLESGQELLRAAIE